MSPEFFIEETGKPVPRTKHKTTGTISRLLTGKGEKEARAAHAAAAEYAVISGKTVVERADELGGVCRLFLHKYTPECLRYLIR
jgi:hypothetical protein